MLLSMQCMVAWFCSCVQVPLEYTLNNAIELSEDEVKQIADDIYDILAELDFAHEESSTATIAPQKCSDAWKIWLRAQFDKGLVPKRIITPADYGNNSDPLISECRSIDLEAEYKEAVKKNSQEDQLKGGSFFLSFAKLRSDVNVNRCSDNFINLDKEKIIIIGMNMNVLENTLSIQPPTFKLYTTFEEKIAEKDFQEKGAEEDMVKDGTIMLLAKTRPVAKGFVGSMPIDLNSDKQQLRDAEGPYTSLDGSMIAIPNAIAAVPETTVVDSQTFYKVPRGAFIANINTRLSVRFSSADAKCAWERYKEKGAKK